MSRAIIVADDHPMCREIMRMAIGIVDPDCTIIYAATFEELNQRVEETSPSLLISDLAMPGGQGLQDIGSILEARPDLPVLIVTAHDRPVVVERIRRLGVRGFLSKSAPIGEIVGVIRGILSGDTLLPDRIDDPEVQELGRYDTLSSAQLRVLEARAGGRLNKQIAHDLGLSEITVKAHVKAILKKLGVVNRTQAILIARRVMAVSGQDFDPKG